MVSPTTTSSSAGGWEPIRTVVDVGGGTGALLASLLRRHPRCAASWLIFPHGRPGRTDHDRSRGDRPGDGGGQSFFDPLPAGADLYLLKSVLNDWPDEPTVAILRRCAQAARPGSSIVVLGGVSADEAPRALGIDMLVAGGKTSTLAQFTELARQAGLDILAAGPQSSGRYLVECRPRHNRKGNAHEPGLRNQRGAWSRTRPGLLPAAARGPQRPGGRVLRAVFGWDIEEHARTS